MSNKKIYRCNRQQNILWLRAAIGKSGIELQNIFLNLPQTLKVRSFKLASLS
jgi:hypothetical protein